MRRSNGLLTMSVGWQPQRRGWLKAVVTQSEAKGKAEKQSHAHMAAIDQASSSRLAVVRLSPNRSRTQKGLPPRQRGGPRHVLQPAPPHEVLQRQGEPLQLQAAATDY